MSPKPGRLRAERHVAAAGGRRSRRGTERVPVRDAFSLAVLLVLAALPLVWLYRDVHIVWVILGGVLGGGLVALIAARRSWSVVSSLAPAVLFGMILGIPLSVPADLRWGPIPDAVGLRTFADGAFSGWKQLVTVEPPLGTFGGLLVPAFCTVYLLSFTAITLLARVRNVGWSLLPVLVLYITGILWGTRDAPYTAWSGVSLMIAALLWMLWRSLPRRTAHSGAAASGQVRRVITAVVLLAITGGVGGSVAAARSSDLDRTVLREAVEVPFDPQAQVSPLVGYRTSVESAGAARELFSVTGLPTGQRLRLAVLDDYDGTIFRVGAPESGDDTGAFQHVPVTVPGREVAPDDLAVSISIEELDGVWLPVPEGATRVEFTDASARTDSREFFYNPALDAAAIRTGLTTGTGYTVRATGGTLAADPEIAALRPGPGRVHTTQSAPEDLLTAAAGQTTPTETAGGKLLAAVRWLRTGYVSHSGPKEPFTRSGHSAERLNLLANSTPMLGDAEQYATAMTVIASELGFPARVVLGYAPTDEHVVGADLTAWTEVQGADGTWVALDPVPEVRPIPDIHRVPEKEQPRPETVIPPKPLVPEDHHDARRNEDDVTAPEDDPEWLVILRAVAAIAVPVLLVLAVLTLPLWGALLGGALRRRARRRADLRADTATGAWTEIRDEILDRGVRVPPASTRREVVAAWEDQQQPAPEDHAAVRALTDQIDRLSFAAEPAEVDTSDATTDAASERPGEVALIWQDVAGLRENLHRGDSRRARLIRTVRARSLRLWLAAAVAQGWRRLRTTTARRWATLGRRTPDTAPLPSPDLSKGTPS